MFIVETLNQRITPAECEVNGWDLKRDIQDVSPQTRLFQTYYEYPRIKTLRNVISKVASVNAMNMFFAAQRETEAQDVLDLFQESIDRGTHLQPLRYYTQHHAFVYFLT